MSSSRLICNYTTQPTYTGYKNITPMVQSVDDIWNEVYTKDCYHLRTANIQPHDLVIDVGAHFGSFSSLAIELGAKVIAYEPNPNTAAALKLAVPQATVHNKAVVGCEPLTRKLIYCPTGERSGDTLYLHEQHRPGIDVECVTLDSVILGATKLTSGPVKFLKLDCEGAEYDIIKHSQFLHLVQYLAIEFHTLHGASLKDAMRKLASVGFIDDSFTTDTDGWFWLYRGHNASTLQG